MVAWCTQNVYQNGSSLTWHQPCNNQTALSVYHFGGYSKKLTTTKNTTKGDSHSLRTCNKSTVSLLESREQHCIKVISNNTHQIQSPVGKETLVSAVEILLASKVPCAQCVSYRLAAFNPETRSGHFSFIICYVKHAHTHTHTHTQAYKTHPHTHRHTKHTHTREREKGTYLHSSTMTPTVTGGSAV